MRKKQKKTKSKFITFLLMILIFSCIGTAGYLYVIIQNKKQEERARIFAEQYKLEQKEAAEAELIVEQESQKEAENNQSEKKKKKKKNSDGPVQVGEQTFLPGFQAEADANTIQLGDTDILSTEALLIDLSTDRIVAQKGTTERIYPASMTKILTILVAAEEIENMDDTFVMQPDIVNYSLSNGCSAAGFVPDEVIPVKDLFYGTILPSGGEAAVALAVYTAGSHEAFVDLMNEKLVELGIADTTHFTNCVGIFDQNHYSTLKDMAMILKAAVENDFCREVLKEHVYYTTQTEQNPEGIILSNWFLRKIEDKDSGGLVTCAKTGFVNESGFCAASYFVSNTGHPYICVTVNTYNEWRCIYDHVAMYKLYTE